MTLVDVNEIHHLQLQIPMKLEINGLLIFRYYPDFTYIDTRSGRQRVEDVKPSLDPKSWDPIFKLKKKAVEAQFGIEVEIVTA